MEDGRLDRFRLAAPAPIAVGEVGEPHGALGIRAVADGAVGGEQASAHLHRLRVLGHVLDGHGRVAGEDRLVLAFGLVHLTLPLGHLGPAFGVAGEDSLPVAQAGVGHQVAGGEQQGADEQHEPPLGQRVVVFLDAVEGVTHGLVRGALGLALAGSEDQPGQRQQGKDGEQGYVPAPESGHSRVLLESFRSSSAKGRLAASSKLLLRLLL
ncbi:hypothetical protein FQZ97_964780 [compost metagenome]